MISVVIPLYNKAHTIERTLGSVLAQTFQDFEVVIVNDGSSDNGVDVIQDFTQDPRVRVINQDNQGVSVARNEGVRHAKYEYIAFLDGDDEWLADYLLKMQEAIQKYPEAGMICGAGTVRSGGREYVRLATKYEGQITEINFFENPHVFVHTSATVVAKTAFNKTEGFPIGMKRNQDYALFFALALHSQTIYCGFPLSVYVGDVEGQATTAPFQVVKEHVARRFNLVHDTWNTLKKNNKVYLIFTKYELRHFFLGFLKAKAYQNIDFFKTSLDKDLLKSFPGWEWYLYTNQTLNKVAIGYIYMTKIRWRLRGYPQLNY